MFDIPLGHGIIYGIIKYGIGILIIAMIIRVFATWFGADERFAFIRFLARMTDPFIKPIRRIVRPVGVLDMSFLIAFFFLITIQVLLLQALPTGW
ncbi:MAG TPA: YggT family protein [Ktedonobacteraceae bacterium]|nr:YggT family protein [Ktedonobacteraceae bacterium]